MWNKYTKKKTKEFPEVLQITLKLKLQEESATKGAYQPTTPTTKNQEDSNTTDNFLCQPEHQKSQTHRESEFFSKRKIIKSNSFKLNLRFLYECSRNLVKQYGTLWLVSFMLRVLIIIEKMLQVLQWQRGRINITYSQFLFGILEERIW